MKMNAFSRFPDNAECLKFLTRLCSDLGMPDAQEYANKLKKLERVCCIAHSIVHIAQVRELRNERRSMSGGSGGRTRTSTSAAGSRVRSGWIKASSKPFYEINSSGTRRPGSRGSIRTASAHIDLTNVDPKNYRVTNPRDIGMHKRSVIMSFKRDNLSDTNYSSGSAQSAERRKERPRTGAQRANPDDDFQFDDVDDSMLPE